MITFPNQWATVQLDAKTLEEVAQKAIGDPVGAGLLFVGDQVGKSLQINAQALQLVAVAIKEGAEAIAAALKKST